NLDESTIGRTSQQRFGLEHWPAVASRRCSLGGSSLVERFSVPNAVQRLLAPKIKTAARDRRSRYEHLIRQRVHSENFILLAHLYDNHIALFGSEIKLAVCAHW